MAVVVIIGILATIAVVGYRRYIASAKTGEAIHMLGSIKSAQEAFRAETFRYMNVSGELSNLYPQGSITQIGKTKWAWEEATPSSIGENFQTLGVSSPNPVMYGYSCVAGGASGGMPQLYQAAEATPDWPETPGGPWYVAEAIGDLDGDGVYGVYATSSLTAAIFSQNDDE